MTTEEHVGSLSRDGSPPAAKTWSLGPRSRRCSGSVVPRCKAAAVADPRRDRHRSHPGGSRRRPGEHHPDRGPRAPLPAGGQPWTQRTLQALLSTGEAKLRPGQGPIWTGVCERRSGGDLRPGHGPGTRLLGVAGHRPRGLLSGDRLAAAGPCRHGRGDAQPVPHRSGRLARGAGPAAAVLRRARRRRCAHGPAAGRARQTGDGPPPPGAGIARADRTSTPTDCMQ